MLKREELEAAKLHAALDGAILDRHGNHPGPQFDELLAAAPKLALACLEALALTRRVVEHFAETDAPLGIAAQDVRSLLFNELTAAGVEAE